MVWKTETGTTRSTREGGKKIYKEGIYKEERESLVGIERRKCAELRGTSVLSGEDKRGIRGIVLQVSKKILKAVPLSQPAPSKRLQRLRGTETNNESLGAISFVSRTIVLDIEQSPRSFHGKGRDRNAEREREREVRRGRERSEETKACRRN